MGAGYADARGRYLGAIHPEAVAKRAPLGLSPNCSANAGMWLTTAVLVYDLAVEAHCPHRVMRQFGQRQEFPVATALDRVERL